MEKVQPDKNEADLSDGHIVVQVEPLDGQALAATAEQLDSDRSDLEELRTQFDSVAHSVRKGDDEIVLQAYRRASLPANLGVLGAAIAGPLLAGSTMLLGLTNAGEIGRSIVRTRMKKPVEIPDGYKLQCLKVHNEQVPLAEGEVVAAIHPRAYPAGEEEPYSLQKQRLADALTVATSSEHVDKIIIPLSVARRQMLPIRDGPYYGTTVRGMHAQTISVPYDEGERAVIIPRELASSFVELLQTDNDPMLTRVLAQLAERYPYFREALRPADRQLVRTLHNVLQPALVPELPSSERRRYHLNVDGNLFWIDQRGSLETKVIPADQYNPRITQRRPTQEQVMGVALRDMTGDEAMYDIARKLATREYNDAELVRVALELLERRGVEQQAAAAEAAVAATSAGGEPLAIVLSSEKQSNRWQHCAQYASRVVLAGVLLTSSIMLANAVAEGLDNDAAAHYVPPPPTVPDVFAIAPFASSEGEPAPDPRGYWTNELSYTYDKSGKWFTTSLKSLDESMRVDVPEPMDESAPHVRVQTYGSDPELALPVREGMQVAAMYAYAKPDRILPVELFQKPDGLYVARVGGTPGEVYKLTYFLTEGERIRVHPTRQLDVPGNDNLNVYSMPGALFGAEAQAAHMAQHFAYEPLSLTRNRHVRSVTAGDYAAAVYGQEICNCLECNGAIAIAQEKLRPNQLMAVQGGYFYETKDKEGRGLITEREGHGWLNVNGTTVDATPMATLKLTMEAQEDSEAKWGHAESFWGRQAEDPRGADLIAPREEQKRLQIVEEEEPFPWQKVLLPLGGMLLAAAVATELRTRALRNSVRAVATGSSWFWANRQIDVRDAVSLMAWESYADKRRNAMPAVGQGVETQTAPHNIPAATLQQIKNGGFSAAGELTAKQHRGLRRVAKLLLAERHTKPRRRKTA
jgi:hypothetical protein